MWESTMGAIPDGWRAVAPDFRGFGQSPMPVDGNADMADLAGDVVDLLDHLKVTDAAIIGCSMGGYVLFEMLTCAPSYVSAMGLVSTRPGADSAEGRKNREKMIELVDRDGVDAVAAQMVPKLVGETSQRSQGAIALQVRSLIDGNSRQGVVASIRGMMGRRDSTRALGHIDVPTLIVAGLEDALISSSEAEAMHRAIPRSRCELMPPVGHLPNLEQPGAFGALIHEFLQRL